MAERLKGERLTGIVEVLRGPTHAAVG
jgi:hypothetical protein